MTRLGGEPRLLFIGVNAQFSERHLTALGRVGCVVENVRPLRSLKRLERALVPSRLARAARDSHAAFHLICHCGHAKMLNLLRSYRPDLVVIAGMGWLLSSEALAVPRLGTLNIHPSLLPAYRGAEPTFWQLYDGVRESGLTVHLADAGEDTGPIVGQVRFPVPPGATLADLLALQLAHGPPLLSAVVREVLAGMARPVPQPPASPTRRARRFVAGDPVMTAWLDLDLDEACRVLRGVGPLLDCPSPSGCAGGYMAFVIGSWPEPSGMPPGRVGRDGSGWFLAHPQGRLRLRWRWLPRAWLLALRRRGAPATGIIAIESAAGLSPAGGAPDL